MAERKTSGRRTTSTRKSSSSGRKRSTKRSTASRNNEIFVWVLLVLSVLLFLSNFGLIGGVGDFLSGIMFGLFGLTSYYLPLLAGAMLLVGILFPKHKWKTKKLAAAGILIAVTGILGEMLTNPDISVYSVAELYRRSLQGKQGGGVLFGSIAHLLLKYLSTVGTVLVLMVLTIIALLLLTDRSLLDSVRKGGEFLYDKAEESRDTADIRRREREEQRLLREEKRQEEQRLREEKRRQRREEIARREEELAAREEERRKRYEEEAEDSLEIPELPFEDPEEFRSDRHENRVNGVLFGDETRIPVQEELEQAKTARDGMHEIILDEAAFDSLEQPEALQEAAVQSSPGLYGEAVAPAAQAVPGMVAAAAQTMPGMTAEAAAAGRSEPAVHMAAEPLFDIGADGEAGGGGDMISAGIPADSAGTNIMSTAEVLGPHNELSGAPGASDIMSTAEVPDPDNMLSGEPGSSDIMSTNTQDAPAMQNRSADEIVISTSGPAEPAANEVMSTTEQPGPTAPAAPAPQDPDKIYVKPRPPYKKPSTEFLNRPEKRSGDSRESLLETSKKLEDVLSSFGVKAQVTDISQGPSVTRYELQPEVGVKVSKIVGLSDDIKLNLAATDIRIEAPIPGKAAVGIEVPNKENMAVPLRDLLESREFQEAKSNLSFVVGKDIAGKIVVGDIAKMPHMLIAGSTGSGKSVCINTIIMSLLYKSSPEDVKLILVDPKVVELSIYNGIPHLLLPVVTDPKKATSALQWGVAEMTDRYRKFAETGARDLKTYNERSGEHLPQIVIIVDELADLMMVASKDVEEAICRITQLARAAGIHLIIATQRPSVDVITGLIKANMPSRIAFAVSSGVDSRTILDMTGAEKLLGKGDMLYFPQGKSRPERVQGGFVSDEEITKVIDYLKEQAGEDSYDTEAAKRIEEAAAKSDAASSGSQEAAKPDDGRDEFFYDAAVLIIDKEKASIGALQRYFKIGFNRAARLMDALAEAGVVGEEEGTKPRKILMNRMQLEEFMEGRGSAPVD